MKSENGLGENTGYDTEPPSGLWTMAFYTTGARSMFQDLNSDVGF